MALDPIPTDQLPAEIQAVLLDGEIPYHFSFIDSNGGCLSTTQAKQWVLVTGSRVVFEASVQDGKGTDAIFNLQSGSIPLAKVSYTGVSGMSKSQGCAPAHAMHTTLRISASGGDIVLAMPTRAEADRTRTVIDAILAGAPRVQA